MTRSNDDMNEILRDEAWLRDVLLDAPMPNVEALKTRVRVAIGEARLAEHLADEPGPPAGLIETVKDAVRAELGARSPAVPRRDTPRWTSGATPAVSRGIRWRRRLVSGGLAAAACLVGAIYLAQPGGEGVSLSADESLAALMALESATDDAFAESVSALDSALSKLEASLNGLARRDDADRPADEDDDALYDVWSELINENQPS